MKKLLVIPIMAAYYLLLALFLPIVVVLISLSSAGEYLNDFAETLLGYCREYMLQPCVKIYKYALCIMQSDKIIVEIKEAADRQKKEI